MNALGLVHVSDARSAGSINEWGLSVYEPRRSKIGSSKKIIGECKYNNVTENQKKRMN